MLRSTLYTPLDTKCIPSVEINDELIDISESLADEICKAYSSDKAPKECMSKLRKHKDFLVKVEYF